MKRRGWIGVEFEADTTFKLRHVVAWVFYVLVLKWNLEALWAVARKDHVHLMSVVVLGFISLVTAGANIEHWLAGANRNLLFRIALILSALVSCVLAAWMTWHYAVFLFVGTVTLFQRPMELITLTLFGERFALVALGVVLYALYAWVSLRVAWVMLSGTRHATIGQVLDHDATYPQAEDRLPEWDAPPAAAPPEATVPPVAEPVAAKSARGSGWAAIEDVFRSEPGMPELVRALEALPGLARSVDATEAAEARDWISRLADHPGGYEVDLPREEIRDPYVRTRTVRVADAALEALIRWDEARLKAN
jgi:hypothetical protein